MFERIHNDIGRSVRHLKHP